MFLCTGLLSLLEHEEEYTFSLPCAYARSILTVPWVELGGKVNINCAKTGYSASINFHTKPFYGGKLHRWEHFSIFPHKSVLWSSSSCVTAFFFCVLNKCSSSPSMRLFSLSVNTWDVSDRSNSILAASCDPQGAVRLHLKVVKKSLVSLTLSSSHWESRAPSSFSWLLQISCYWNELVSVLQDLQYAL